MPAAVSQRAENIEPEGFEAISRWLSPPPVDQIQSQCTPGGVPDDAEEHREGDGDHPGKIFRGECPITYIGQHGR